MRPLKLVMTGFESYRDKTEINFEDLGKNGLYLIAGDTGAGKTTIFDAITFALYGSPSGTDRSVDMLRSHFADENTPTVVELEFEANGNKYKVIRNPDYERKVRRGNGTTKEPASAVLTYLSEEKDPVSGLSKVNEAVQTILNLKKDQFCRIAMIAQGSFQKLLLSDKNEKGKIFRELFHTEKYERLQSVLGDEKKETKMQLDELSMKFKDALSRIEISETDELYKDVNRIKTSGYVDGEDIRILKEFVSKDEKTLTTLLDDISKVEKEIETINKNLQIGENRKKLEEQISFSKKLFVSKEGEKSEINKIFEAANKRAEEIPSLTKDKNLLESSLSLYEEIFNAERDLSELSTKLSENLNSKNSFVQAKIEKENEIKDLKEKFESLKNAGENIISLDSALEKNQTEKKELEEIEDRLDKLASEDNLLNLALAAFAEANAEFSRANASYTEKIQLFNLEQAGILAETLKEGMPCPVCGSIDHPHLAAKSHNAPTQKEVEDAKNLLDSISAKANKLSLDAGNKKGLVQSLVGNINDLLSKYFEGVTARDSDLAEKMNSKKKDNENACLEIKDSLCKEMEAKKQRESLEVEIPKAENEMNKISECISKLDIAISSEKAKLEADKKNLLEKKSGLKFSDYDSAKKELERLEKVISRLNSDVEDAGNAKVEYENFMAKIKGEIEGLEKELKKIPEVDVEKLTSEKNKQLNIKDSLNSQRDSMNERKGVNQESVQKIEVLLPKISSVNDRYNMISALYEVSTGTNRGQGRPSLETYVQMHCLDQINRRANLRFKTMTDNKYELRRRIEDDGSELGLDLNVKDFYTGRERNVHTLSGGEQFQASLSLALGLADEIQANSGGIKLDAMFIDEGFGTLDGDTLNKAMKALEDLSQGNKLVGIISHVDELETRIPSKIYIKKDESGISHARMVKD